MSWSGRTLLLLFMIALSLGGGYVYIQYQEKDYTSKMVLRASLTQQGAVVESVDQFDPEEALLTIAHSTLDENRMPAFLENLRFAVREHFYVTELSIEGGPLRGEIPQSAGPLLAMLAEREETIESFVGMMDTQLMARILKAMPTTDARLRQWVQTGDSGRGRFVDALQLVCLPERQDATAQEIRQAAINMILQKIQSDPKIDWLEVYKEAYAMPLLQEIALYNVVGIPQGLDAVRWVRRIKEGIHVYPFADTLLPVRCTLSAVSESLAIPQQVLSVYGAMIEVEYSKTGQGEIQEMRAGLEASLASYREEIQELRKQATDATAKMMVVRRQQQLSEELERSARTHLVLPLGWQAAFDGAGEMQEAVARVKKLFASLQDLDEMRATLAVESRVLQRYIEEPKNQYVMVEITRREQVETPLLRSLREEKRELHLAYCKLLKTSTTAHPMVRKMRAEIQELEQKIVLHDVPSQPMVIKEKRSNPKLVDWKRDLSDAKGRLRAMQAQRDLLVVNVVETLGTMKAFFKDQADEIRQDAILVLQKRIDESQAKIASLESRAAVGAGLITAFDVHTRPTIPSVTMAQPSSTVYAVAVGTGLLFSILVMLVLGGEQVIRTSRASVPLHETHLPVLATISSFE